MTCPTEHCLKMGPGFKLKSTWLQSSCIIIHLPGDGVGATLGNPEMLCVTDGDTKAYGREAMCSDKLMQTMAELSPECCHFHATITASRIHTLTLWPEIWPKPINGLGKLYQCILLRDILKHLVPTDPPRWCLWALISLLGSGLVTEHRLWS